MSRADERYGRAPDAWVFEVDPRDLDLAGSFADGEAVLQFEVDDACLDVIGPGQVAHLWIEDRVDHSLPAGVYATGSVVGPVLWVQGEGDRFPAVEVGFDALLVPVDGLALLAGDEFVGSPLHGRPSVANPVPLDPAQAQAIAANPLDPGPLAPAVVLAGDTTGDVTGDVLDDEDEYIVLPALQVRLPADTLLVVGAADDDRWTVVRGSADLTEVEELPERHRTFVDAVEYVASVADQAAADLPAVGLDERDIEAVAVFDADGGVYVVVKEEPDGYVLCWVEDDGTVERVDAYASLKEAILLPVLDPGHLGEA